jgi:hypothetical protein
VRPGLAVTGYKLRERLAAPAAEKDGEAGALPEFLSDDAERDVAADEDRPQCQAAE